MGKRTLFPAWRDERVLRISCREEPDAGVTVKLEGQVRGGPWLEELRQVCERLLAAERAITLDLTDVSFIDLHGVALCHDLRDHKVAFIYGSLFVEERLKG